MIWPEYQAVEAECTASRNRLRALVSQREELYWMTQPQGISYDKEKVQTSPSDHITNILSKIVDIDQLISLADQTLIEREHLLEVEDKALRRSREPEDRIYAMYFIDHYSPNKVARVMNYHRSQVFRILKKMRPNATKCDF